MEIVLVFGWFDQLIYFRCLVSGFSRLEGFHWELHLDFEIVDQEFKLTPYKLYNFILMAN